MKPSPLPTSAFPLPTSAKTLGFRRDMVLARRRPDNPKLLTRRLINMKRVAT